MREDYEYLDQDDLRGCCLFVCWIDSLRQEFQTLASYRFTLLLELELLMYSTSNNRVCRASWIDPMGSKNPTHDVANSKLLYPYFFRSSNYFYTAFQWCKMRRRLQPKLSIKISPSCLSKETIVSDRIKLHFQDFVVHSSFCEAEASVKAQAQSPDLGKGQKT